MYGHTTHRGFSLAHSTQLQNQRTYLDNVLKQVALEDLKFAPSRNTSKTTFPTLVFRPFANPSPMETGRRRRAQAGNRGAAAADRDNPQSAKRRRYNNDDADHRPVRRDRDSEAQERGNGRRRCVPSLARSVCCGTDTSCVWRRPGSPAESMLSITSHAQIMRGAGQYGPNGLSTPKARPRPAAQVHRNGPGTPRSSGLMDAVMNSKDAYNSPRMTAPPGLGHPAPYADQYGSNGGQRWDDGAGPNILVGPGAVVVDADGDADGDQDERTYCYCDTVSYGDMVACDGDECPREWVRTSLPRPVTFPGTDDVRV